MNWIEIVWPMMAAASVTLALIYFAIWLKGRTQPAHLMFALLAMSVAVIAAFELMMMRAQTPAEFGVILRWMHLPLFMAFVSVVGFVHFYFRAGYAWLAYSAIGVRMLVLVVNFFSVTNINYLRMTALHQMSIPGGGTISVAEGIANPARRIAELSLVLLLAFVASAWVEVWRKGNPDARRRAAVICGSLVIFIGTASAHAILIHAGVVQMPYLITALFLLVIAAVGYELGSDVIRVAQLSERLQASQAQIRASEQRMTLVTGATNLGLWEWDVARDAMWITPKGRELLGLAPDRSVGLQDFLGRVRREDRDGVHRAIERALGGSGAYEQEFRVEHTDGSARWIAVRGQVEFDQDRHAALMRGVALDVTARKEIEGLFRAVVEAAPNAMAMVDQEGRIALSNAQASILSGYPRDSLERMRVDTLLPDGLRSNRRDPTAEDPTASSAGAAAPAREAELRRKDGTAVPVELHVNLLETASQTFLVASMIDISARKQAELGAARQRDELAHLSRVVLLGELSGSIAHELNQPLTAILSNAQAAEHLLAREPLDIALIKEILADIVKNDKRAGEIIRRLRTLFRKEETRYQRLNANDVVRETLALMWGELNSRGVTVSTELLPTLPSVRGDRIQLQQVLLNLVTNACDAIDGPAGPRQLAVRTRISGEDDVEIAVVDTGRGIAPDDLERILDPFFSTKPEGMGLGLTVCKTIVEAHGGRLWATNNEGRGATMHVALPAARK